MWRKCVLTPITLLSNRTFRTILMLMPLVTGCLLCLSMNDSLFKSFHIYNSEPHKLGPQRHSNFSSTGLVGLLAEVVRVPGRFDHSVSGVRKCIDIRLVTRPTVREPE
jgi:hypothetical protein